MSNEDKDPKKGIPEAVLKSTPKLTLEMPGPLGEDIRRERANKQFAKDYAASNAARAKNFADKDKSSFVVSRDNVRDGTKGLLGKQFNGKSKGKDI